MKMLMNEEMKSCPFCGVAFKAYASCNGYYIQHEDTVLANEKKCPLEVFFDTEDELIEAINKRVEE